MGRILKTKKNKQKIAQQHNPTPYDYIVAEDKHLNTASILIKDTKLSTFTITNGATGEYRILNVLNKTNNIQDELPPGHYNDIWDGDW